MHLQKLYQKGYISERTFFTFLLYPIISYYYSQQSRIFSKDSIETFFISLPISFSISLHFSSHRKWNDFDNVCDMIRTKYFQNSSRNSFISHTYVIQQQMECAIYDWRKGRRRLVCERCTLRRRIALATAQYCGKSSWDKSKIQRKVLKHCQRGGTMQSIIN